MSTTSASRNAPLADDFPVLLRLPDLNTPVWSPAASPLAMEASSKMPEVAAPFRLDAVASAATESASAPAVAPAMAATATTVETVPAEPITLPASRIERMTRGLDVTNFTQWSLVKQLSTGGVLVGGLALAYLMVMGSGPEKTPDHIPLAQQATDVPVVELPTESPEVTVVAKVGTDSKSPTDLHTASPATSPSTPASDFPKPQPVPEYAAEFNADVVAPPPVAVMTPGRTPSGIAPVNGTSPAFPAEREPRNAMLPPDSREAQHNPADYRGRIGPQNGLNNMPPAPALPASPAPPQRQQPVASGYPVTDPNTYLYRPAGETPPDAERPGVARLQGTIAPPPLR